jgi:apolipoprotein D and lipocalin family protein
MTPRTRSNSLYPNPTNVSQPLINLSKYLGKWFEIGSTRVIKNTFEKDLDNVTAEYSFLPNGTIQVINSGVNRKTSQVSTVTGNAKVLSSSELKVSFGGYVASFFQNLIPGPNYKILNIWVNGAGEYIRALVVSPQYWFIPNFLQKYFQYIWILARRPVIPDREIRETLNYAEACGFDPRASKWKKTLQQR